MLAVPLIATGETFEVGAPELLFPARLLDGGANPTGGREYDVAPDGRFLINTVLSEGGVDPIRLILNWNPQAAQ